MSCNIFSFHNPLLIKWNNINVIFYGILQPQEKKMHLIKWVRITSPNELGGLGIQQLRPKNNALLASLAWRLFQYPKTLWARIC